MTKKMGMKKDMPMMDDEKMPTKKGMAKKMPMPKGKK